MLLTDPLLQANKPKMLVVCNKSDATLAKGAKAVQAQLEKEMYVQALKLLKLLESRLSYVVRRLILCNMKY